MIQVRRTGEGDPLEFEVIVREGKGETRHDVTMSRETCERLTAGKHTPERCLEAAFRFLLDREPKESIIRRFDVTLLKEVGQRVGGELNRAPPVAPVTYSRLADDRTSIRWFWKSFSGNGPKISALFRKRLSWSPCLGFENPRLHQRLEMRDRVGERGLA
jgi:hypothetical protein